MNDNATTVLCIGMLDTKGDEIRLLADAVREAGAQPRVMELSLGGEVDWADIPLSEVLAEDNVKKENVFSAPRSDAIRIVGQAGAKKIEKLRENGDGPVWWPDPDNPKWSRRATEMWEIFNERVNRNNSNLDLVRCDSHILDDDFAALLNQCMNDMLAGTWKPGLYRDNSIVIADAV